MLDIDPESKKMIFLYPHLETERTVIPEIIKDEYEVFVSNNHEQLSLMITQFIKTFVFINIDKISQGVNWEKYVKELLEKAAKNESSETSVFGICRDSVQLADDTFFSKDKLLSYSEGADGVSSSVLQMLKDENAKGRRKYVRAHCNDVHHASFSIKRGGSFYQGVILDISTNGMACRFNDHVHIANKTYLDDLQLRLDGAVMKIAGTVAASRKGSSPVYVIIFDYRLTLRYREKIQYFVYHEQQREFDQFLKDSKKKSE